MCEIVADEDVRMGVDQLEDTVMRTALKGE